LLLWTICPSVATMSQWLPWCLPTCVTANYSCCREWQIMHECQLKTGIIHMYMYMCTWEIPPLFGGHVKSLRGWPSMRLIIEQEMMPDQHNQASVSKPHTSCSWVVYVHPLPIFHPWGRSYLILTPSYKTQLNSPIMYSSQ